jgi:hypothetical protein
MVSSASPHESPGVVSSRMEGIHQSRDHAGSRLCGVVPPAGLWALRSNHDGSLVWVKSPSFSLEAPCRWQNEPNLHGSFMIGAVLVPSDPRNRPNEPNLHGFFTIGVAEVPSDVGNRQTNPNFMVGRSECGRTPEIEQTNPTFYGSFGMLCRGHACTRFRL